MSQWVTLENIADFQWKIAAESDPAKRRILEELLAKEQQKLRDGARAPSRPER